MKTTTSTITTATREQERAALKKIMAIVEGLGEGSYLSYAFDGCFDVAESNIENDFADSLKEKVINRGKEIEHLHFEIDKLNNIVSELEKERENRVQRMEEESELLKATQKALSDEYGVNKKIMEKLSEKESILREKELETTKLKAQLFDLLYAKKTA